MRERVVYLKDVGKYLLRHWVAAVILTLVSGIALNFFAPYKDGRTTQGVNAKTDALLTLEVGLSEREIADARTAADGYMLVYNQIMRENERIKESPLFLLEDATAFEDHLVYRVQPEEGLPRDSEEMILRNYAELLTGSLEKTLTADGIGEKEARRLRELSVIEAEDGLLIVRTFGEDEETVMKAGAEMKKAVNAASDRMRAGGETRELLLVSEDCRTGVQSSLMKERLKALEALQELSGLLPVFSENLTSGAKKYFDAVVECEKSIVESSKTPRRWFYPKWAALGVSGGFFLFLLIFVLAYLFSTKIRNSMEVREGLGVPVVFDVSLTGRNKNGAVSTATGIASMLDRICYSENGASVRKVTVFAGSGETEVQEQLIRAMKDAGIEPDVIEDVKAEERLMKRLSESDGVLFVKRIGKDRFDEMEREIEAVKPSGKPVFGAILLRD